MQIYVGMWGKFLMKRAPLWRKSQLWNSPNIQGKYFRPLSHVTRHWNPPCAKFSRMTSEVGSLCFSSSLWAIFFFFLTFLNLGFIPSEWDKWCLDLMVIWYQPLWRLKNSDNVKVPSRVSSTDSVKVCSTEIKWNLLRSNCFVVLPIR